MVTHRKYTEEILEDAVLQSTSVAGVLRHLGVRPTGGAHAHISRTIKSFGIDTSHFRDHLNGEYLDNTLENLRFLCPNCHRQTDNFAGRSKGRFSGHATAVRAIARGSYTAGASAEVVERQTRGA